MEQSQVNFEIETLFSSTHGGIKEDLFFPSIFNFPNEDNACQEWNTLGQNPIGPSSSGNKELDNICNVESAVLREWFQKQSNRSTREEETCDQSTDEDIEDLVVKGLDVPTQYTAKKVQPHEMPVIG